MKFVRSSVGEQLKRYSRFGAGSAASAVTTYVLFLTFAHAGGLRELGRYGVLMVFIGALVNVVVMVPEQRIVQEGIRIGRRGEMGSYARQFTGARLGLAGAVGVLIFACFQFASGDLELSGSVAFCFFSQCAFGAALGSRILDAGGRTQLSLQILGAAVAGLFVFLTFLLWETLTASLMLLIFGIARFVAASPAAILDLRRSRKATGETVSLVSVLFAKPARPNTGWIALLQMGNVLTGSLDTLIVGVSSSVGVANYQLALRPLQGLAVLNGAVGQMAFNSNVGATGHSVPLSSIRSMSLWIIPTWTVLSIPAYFIAYVTAPPGSSVLIEVFLGLGLAGGLSALSAVMGPSLIVRGRTSDVVGSALCQIVTLALVGSLGVALFGYAGIVWGVFSARLLGCIFQYWRLGISYSKCHEAGPRETL